MPFIALCPHCRSAKLKAPSRKRGLLHECPKCRQTFPLEPMDESGLKVDYKLPPEEFDIEAAYKAAPVDDFAAARTMPHELPFKPTATASEVVTMSAEEKQPSPAADPELSYTPDVKSLEPPMVLAIAAGGVFGLAMILTQIPYGRLLALPCLLCGVILGLIATRGLESRKPYGFAAVGLNVLGLLLVVFFADWLGVDSWMPRSDPNTGPKPVLAVSRSDGSMRPAEWIDAQQECWQQDDVRVEVLSARIEFLNPKPKKNDPNAKRVLRIGLKVVNVGVARAFNISGWPVDAPPRLSLSSGPVVPFVKVETSLPRLLMPGKDAEVLLLFDVPPALTEALMLELPGSGFESTEAVKLKIPSVMISK